MVTPRAELRWKTVRVLALPDALDQHSVIGRAQIEDLPAHRPNARARTDDAVERLIFARGSEARTRKSGPDGG